jgi:hypothetical protein
MTNNGDWLKSMAPPRAAVTILQSCGQRQRHAACVIR